MCYFSSATFLAAESPEELDNDITEKIPEPPSLLQQTLLVLENAFEFLELKDYFDPCFHLPLLITSTNSAISHLASSPACTFQFPAARTQQARSQLAKSIREALENKQHISTLVASGGTGKTQIVLKFISDNPSR